MKKLFFTVVFSFAIFFIFNSEIVRAEWGAVTTESEALTAAPAVLDVKPKFTFQQSRYATAGVPLRNHQLGTITLSGVPPGSKVVKAYLYWIWASLAVPTPAHSNVTFKRVEPLPGGPAVPAVGVAIGTGPDPCWIGPSNYVYRADVTPQVTGSGVYAVILSPASGASFDGSDPWGPPGAVAPLAEGASLVVVYQNAIEPMGTVRIYDVGLAGNMAMGALSYNLLGLPPGGTLQLWDTIGGDGQIGSSRLPTLATELTTIDGVPVAGPGSAYNDSDWNGADGKPIPQLWDDHGHDVRLKIGAAGSSLVSFTSLAGVPDCWVPAANVTLTFP